MIDADETTALATAMDFSIDDLNEVDVEDERSGPEYVTFKSGVSRQFRILPPSPAWAAWFKARGRKAHPFFMAYKHLYENPMRPGKYVSYVCPAKNPSSGERRECKDCEQAFALFAEQSPQAKEAGKTIMAKKKVMFCVIERGDEEAGPKIIEFSAPWTADTSKKKGQPTQFEKLERLWKVKKKNLVSPNADGWDFTVLRVGDGREGTSYDIDLVDGPSLLSSDPEQIAKWVMGQPNLPQLVTPPSDSELVRILGMTALPTVRQGSSQRQLKSADHPPSEYDDPWTAQDVVEEEAW